MKVNIKLAAEDRNRLGAPEVVEYDLDRPRLKEVREVYRQCGLSWNEFVQKVNAGDVEAGGIYVWLAVIRAGVAVAWNDFDIDVMGFEVEVEEESPKNSSAPDGATTN